MKKMRELEREQEKFCGMVCREKGKGKNVIIILKKQKK